MNVLAEYVTKIVNVEDEEVTIKKLSVNDNREIDLLTNHTDKGVQIILRSVVKWTFKNSNDSPIPVSEEIIMRLRGDILNTLIIECSLFNLPIKTKKVEKPNG